MAPCGAVQGQQENITIQSVCFHVILDSTSPGLRRGNVLKMERGVATISCVKVIIQSILRRLH